MNRKNRNLPLSDNFHSRIAIDLDVPLISSHAIAQDKLSRDGFAKIAATALHNVSSSTGLVLSIEGAWGSGKTSTLAMIEELLVKQRSLNPLVVHFNPWLVGEKEALLRLFLTRIASEIKLSDRSNDGKKVAKELKAYAKIFDVVKLIPGAEPWATLIKTAMEATGAASESVADYKTPNIEAYKKNVEEALRRFNRPIIVFIDDIDRLFPFEVFEMVRIIKAVGGLPNLGYVVAWDSVYVSEALGRAGVPQSARYLDKIVQVRMPLPSLSLAARKRLLDEALSTIDPDAMKPRFRGQEQRLSYLYHSGLSDLLDQPRDVARIFNALRMLEPLLRGEVVFADILALATLSVKAPAVFELLKSNPRIFVGRLPGDLGVIEKQGELLKFGSNERKLAYKTSNSSSAVRRVVHFLFPEVAKAEGQMAIFRGSFADGNISHPGRLLIAIQLSIADGDVSIRDARRYLEEPFSRLLIGDTLCGENCNEFVELVGALGVALGGDGITDIEQLCVDLARLVDHPVLVERLRVGRNFAVPIENSALSTAGRVVAVVDNDKADHIAALIATDSKALSCAATLISRRFTQGAQRYDESLTLREPRDDEIDRRFVENVLAAATNNELFQKARPGRILSIMARQYPKICTELFEILRNNDPTLDTFAQHYFGTIWDSNKGTAFLLPDDGSHEAFCSFNELTQHARMRVQDENVLYPSRAVWRSIIEGKSLYGVDGTEAKY